MNQNKLLKKLSVLLLVVAVMCSFTFAQNTVYVDVTNGSDTYTGANATNNPAGTGPKASFAAARALVTEGGTIVIKAGTYAEAMDLSTGLLAATKNYTVKLSQLNSNNDINFTAAGAAVINKTGLTVTFATEVGTEKINLTTTTFNLTDGNINLGSANAMVLANGTTINVAGTSAFTNAAPTKTTNVSVAYTGAGSFTAGPESNYATYGTGTISVGKTAGTTITFANDVSVAGLAFTSGNATFSGAVTVAAGAGDVLNSGTGTVTFNGALSLGIVTGAALDANLASIENTNTGAIVANSTTTWTVPTTLAAAAFANALGTDAVHNASSGSVLLNGAVTLSAPNNTTGNDYSFFANNAGTGTLTIGALSTPSSGSGNFEGTLNLVGNATAGTINIAGGTYANTVTVGATHTLNVNGATTVGAVFTNAGTTALGANILTLSGNSAHVTVGGTVSATTGYINVTSTGAGVSFNGGTLGNLVNNGTGNTVNLSAATTFTNVTATKGTITVGAASTINGTLTLNGGNVTDGNFTITVNNYEQSTGTFTLAANAASILDVKGNFNRTGGTFTAGAASLVSFTGTTAQTVNGGPLFQADKLTFNNAAGSITVGNSIRAAGAVTIATATNIDFGTTNLILNGTNNGITNNGTYTATGGGGVVIGGVNTVVGGVAGAGAGVTYTLQGTGTYSYITVDVGAANLAEVTTTLTGVKWNGVLTLRSGTLDIATAGVDFSPIGSAATIVRYPEDAPGITTTAGTFNAANVQYDLTYTGAITANRAVGAEISATPANVRTWTVQTTGAFNNQLPANGLTFGGTLIVKSGATVSIPTDAGAGDLFVLSGSSKAHEISGTFTVTDADALSITGTDVTVTGTDATTAQSSIHNVTVSGTNVKFAAIKAFPGTFTTTGTSTVEVGMGALAANQVITGAIALGGNSLTLATDITSTAGVTQSAGSVVLGANDLIMNAGYTQTAGTISSTGGYLQFNTAAGLSLVSAVPYLRANDVTVTLATAVTVSENLDLADPAGGALGVIANGGNNVTIQKAMTTTGGAVFTGAGALVLAGADDVTVTASGNPTITNLTVNNDSTAILASTSTVTARTFTVSGALTHTKGELALGANDVSLTGAGAAYARTAGTITAGTGELIFAGGAAQTAAQGTGFSIPNLTIANTTGGAADVSFAGGATNDFTVTGTLKLTQGTFSSTAAGKLHLANGATISRVADNASLVEVPTFDGDVHLAYTTFNGVAPVAAAMANEVPTAASGKLADVTLAIGATNTLNTAAATTFKGTATLTSGIFGNAGGAITIGSGATVVMNGGTFGAAPTATNYNLTYQVTMATTNTEFQSAKVDLLKINKAGITVTLNAAKTVKDLTIAAGTLNNGGFDLTLTGNFNAAGGAYAGAGNMVIGGTDAQTFTVPTTGLTLAGSLTLNNAAGVTLAGGNLTMGANINFVDGIFYTGDDFRITLNHTVAGQGFDRSAVVAGKLSHIVGNVAQAITAGAGSPTVYANGRYEFPVGTATYYRPYAITFSQSNPAINPTTVVVKHVDSDPEGTQGLPIGNIGNYAKQYWLVKTTPSSFTSTQYFDVEMHGTNLGYPYTNEQDLRIIRRQDGSSTDNTWYMQGTDANYGANYQVVTGTAPNQDTLVVIRSTATLGGIVNEGTRFAIGMPTQAPVFLAPDTTEFSVHEDSTLTIQFTADPNAIGATVTYSLVEAPEFATIDAATGLVTLKPNATHYKNSPYTLKVKATTNQGFAATKEVKINVLHTYVAPKFTARINKVEARYGEEFKFEYKATDEDGQAIKFMLASVTGDTTSADTLAKIDTAGVFTWTPAKADSGKTVYLTVKAMDANDTTTIMDTLMVVGNRAPVIDETVLPDTVEFGQGQTYTFQLEATDADGDELTWTLLNDTKGAELSESGEFTWDPAEAGEGTYLIKIKVTDGNGGEDTWNKEIRVEDLTGITSRVGDAPENYFMNQNYPNPFNPTTKVKFGIKVESTVKVLVYNVLGQQVRELANETMAAGTYVLDFDASDLPSGMYIYRIKAVAEDGSDEFIATKKAMLVK